MIMSCFMFEFNSATLNQTQHSYHTSSGQVQNSKVNDIGQSYVFLTWKFFVFPRCNHLYFELGKHLYFQVAIVCISSVGNKVTKLTSAQFEDLLLME